MRKSRTYKARRGTGNYATSKRTKKRTLAKVTGGMARLKDFERRVVIPVAINCAGHWPVSNSFAAMSKAEIQNASHIDVASSYLKQGILSDPAALEYGPNCQEANQNVASYHSYAQTSMHGASGQIDRIPPSGTLQKGALLICEPLKWQQQNPNSVAADGSILTQNPDHASTGVLGSEFCAMMSGQRAMAGYIKANLRFVHNKKAVKEVTIPAVFIVDAADKQPGAVGYVPTVAVAGAAVGYPGTVLTGPEILAAYQLESLSSVQVTEQECPITVRVTIVKLRGKLIDEDGDVREDFKILKPFPVGTSKYTKLFDTTFTLSQGGHKALDFTLSLNQWLGRKGGIYETGQNANAEANGLLKRNDARFLGGDVRELTTVNVQRRVEPFCEFAGADMANPDLDTSSYNSDTTRIVMLMQTTDDAVGGLFSTATSAGSLSPSPGEIACAGYLTACCFDEK